MTLLLSSIKNSMLDSFLALLSHSSVSKESACNAGDPSSIPGLGRSSGEGIGYPLQYSWASLFLATKNPPAMRETWGDLGWKDPLEKGRLPTPVFLPGEVHGLYSLWGHKELDMTEQLSLSPQQRILAETAPPPLQITFLYYLHYSFSTLYKVIQVSFLKK